MFYTKKEVEKVCRDINKKEVYTDKEGKTHCGLAFPFRIARGVWAVLIDESVTDMATFETTFRVRYLDHTVYGTSQEDCLMKIIACLTGEIYNGKDK